MKCFEYYWSLTLFSLTASLTGQNLWLLCVLESRHTKHTGCWSSRQKSLSFSLWRWQTDEDLSLLSCKKLSHRFFRTRFNGGSSLEDLLLQTGQSLDPLFSQNVWIQSLQKLWLQDNTTGSLKTSQHTGQEKSSSEKHLDTILWVKRHNPSSVSLSVQ